MGAFLAAKETMWGPRLTPEMRAMFSANDLQALIAALSVEEDLGLEDLLPTITVPCLLYGGGADPAHAGAEECARRMPDATVITLPGLDHVEAVYHPDRMVPHIHKFLAEVGDV
jgi:pimeloyl-ACP methyl ester carboxylesterase